MDEAGRALNWIASASLPDWLQFLLVAAMAVKLYPLVKAKLNEARKIELDSDADFRGDLLARIKELETAQREDRIAFGEAMAAERRRCEEDLGTVRTQLADANGRIKELEGYMLGQGRARQEAADIVARERLADKGWPVKGVDSE